MALRFCSGSVRPAQRAHELVLGLHDAQLHVGEGAAEERLDLLGLAVAQEAVVHEDAGELGADGAGDERRRDGRVHAAREAADHARAADLGADLGHRARVIMSWGDQSPCAPQRSKAKRRRSASP
jgi:hypothetical protein